MKLNKYMLCGIFFVNIVFSQLLIVNVACAGQIYHCQGADGSMSFQSTPCEDTTLKVENTKEDKIQSKSSSDKEKSEKGSSADKKNEKENKESLALTESMLLGTWTDLPDEPKVRGLWVFSRSSLHVTNHLGVSYTHKYEVKGNILTVHHDAIPGLKQKAWKQEIVIDDFDGKRITFGEGGPAGTRYIYKIK